MVGTRCIDVEDPSRQEDLGPKEGIRKFTIRFYYPGAEPAAEAGAEPAAAEGAEPETEGLQPCDLVTDEKIKPFCKKPDYTWYKERVKVYEDLPIAAGPFPLILYSHGYGGCAEQNSDLCQYLAEAGYIVASISHTYEASVTTFQDGTKALFDNEANKGSEPLIPTLISMFRKMTPEKALEMFNDQQRKYSQRMVGRLDVWLEDDRVAIKRIHELAEDETSFLYQKIDFSHGIGATGHSFGGAAAYAHCLRDEEITCGINMDGGLYGEFGEAVNHKPFLQMVNPWNVNFVTRCYLYHDRPVHFMLFRDMRHLGFTDVKMLTKNNFMLGKANPEKALNTINRAHAAFFNRYLKRAAVEDRSKLPVGKEMLEKYEVL